MPTIADKLAGLWPEIVMLLGAAACLASGLSAQAALRRITPWIAGGAMALAWVLTLWTGVDANHPLGLGGMVSFVKCLILALGIVLLLVCAGVPEALKQTRAADDGVAGFNPGLSVRGEFYCFFLLSITGVMLTAGATDLVWLFLALELTSLPTYVMIAITRDRTVAHESAVKYFFLGALSAATFLYGFALIYGATGFTEFGPIRDAIAVSADTGLSDPSPLMLLGVVLAVLGLCFKVAAVPMHVYTADVYQGAATPVTAFLAVVPKAAGFAALILILHLLGLDRLPEPVLYLLGAIGVLTMTVGNVLAFIQTNLKRVMAYSSVANSGYMMLGLMAGLGVPGNALGSGPAAVLFFLLVYGFGSVGAFAVIASLQAQRSADDHPEDQMATGVADDLEYDDLAGLWWRSPVLGGVLLVSMLSLVGMPPLAGFAGKFFLIGGVLSAGFYGLVVVLVINSAISAGYYLRIAMLTFFGESSNAPAEILPAGRHGPRVVGALVAGIAGLVVGGLPGNGIVKNARQAFEPVAVEPSAAPEPAGVDSQASSAQPDAATGPEGDGAVAQGDRAAASH